MEASALAPLVLSLGDAYDCRPNTQGQTAHSDPLFQKKTLRVISFDKFGRVSFAPFISRGKNALAIQNHAINFLFAPDHRARPTWPSLLSNIFPSNFSNLMEWFSSAKQHFKLQLILGMAAPKDRSSTRRTMHYFLAKMIECFMMGHHDQA